MQPGNCTEIVWYFVYSFAVREDFRPSVSYVDDFFKPGQELLHAHQSWRLPDCTH